MATKKTTPPDTGASTAPADLADLVGADFEAAATAEQIEQLEKAAQTFGVNRRMALSVLVSSKADFLARNRERPDEAGHDLLDAVEAFNDYEQHLKVLLDMVGIARTRALIVAATLEGGRA